MTGQTWTPAPKKGIIPLHPLTFGMLLGRSFAALRHNPKVLFGFGVMVQLAVVTLSAVVMGFVFATTFARMESLSPSSPDFEAVFAGVIAMNIVAGIAVGLASVAFTALMQGVVAAEIGYASLGVKAGLGDLWRKMAPSFWRLAAFAALSVLFVFGVVIAIFLVIAAFVAGGVGTTAGGIAGMVILSILIVLATVPLAIWLSTKLLLVPSILVLERAPLRAALVRSWRLTRGRFWTAFGVTFLIGAIMGLAMQVVNLPVSLLSSMLGGVIAPTGSMDSAEIMGFVFAILAPQILLLVLQAITLVVQSSAGTLVYLDSRMRYEGLDQTLITHVERRDLGWTDEQLDDPFIVDAARAVSSAPPPAQVPDWVLMSTDPAAAYPQGYPAGAPAAAPAYPSAPPMYGAPAATYAPPAPYPAAYGTPAAAYPPTGYPPAAPYPPAPPAYGTPPASPPYAPAPYPAPQPSAPPAFDAPTNAAPPTEQPRPAAPPAPDQATTWAPPGSGGQGQA